MRLQSVIPDKKWSLFAVAFAATACVAAQEKTDKWLQELILNHASPFLKNILQQPDTFQYQLIYTRINRNKNNKPHFKNYFLRVDKDRYFNPASMVKMPVAFLAMEKLHRLKMNDVNIYTCMFTDSSYSKQRNVWQDSTAENGVPSIAQYIRRIFLISDNDAYNRLYEFAGQQTLNEGLRKRGYVNSRITRRFEPMSEDENRHTNQVRFFKERRMVYEQPPAFNSLPFDFSKKILIGNAHYNGQDQLVNAPMDFTTHNCMPLEDLQRISQSVLFPGSVPHKQRFHLTGDDYRFLYQYMSEYPSESTFPHYDSTEYFDSYTKFFFFRAGRSKIPGYIRSFNKTGWSYGFLTDVAYIADFKNNVEFMVSGVIYVNSDGILNDDKYEYEQTGYPFFKEIGNIIYQYEQTRIRKNRPDLRKFEIIYH
ncbi:MAG: serine hydrolase [Ginsengibacter sp.]